jgi:EAL domain-containing protein (putative c-di-GMP-specific phosphodiesterase class I)/CheY-like chemotaxis protein
MTPRGGNGSGPNPGGEPTGLGRALVVDDDDPVRHTIARVLGAAGFTVDEADGGRSALARLGEERFDVVVTDISMPGMDGIRLLREIRTRDSHVQVILVTGNPSLETAVSALDYGACKYLEKPIEMGVLTDAVKRAVNLSRLARMESRAAALSGNTEEQEADVLGLDVSFERALATSFVAYQPILDAGTGETFGYEALLRSHEAGFQQPASLLDAAERLDRLNDLGRFVRENSVQPFDRGLSGSLLFVNLHPADLLDPLLGARGTRLREMASRVVLEITERASLHKIPDSAARIASLRDLGFRIAVDDLGAGYAGLSSFAHLSPDFVKLDMSLVRDIEQNDTKRRVVAAMTKLAKDLDMTVIAEGVETEGEGNTLRELGCDLLQGFLYAAPGAAFPAISWPHGERRH